MKKFVYNWMGCKKIGGRKTHFSITYLGKCIDGWKDYYGDLKPWQMYGYSNPILCKNKNWGYDEHLDRYRVIFCLFWHQIQW